MQSPPAEQPTASERRQRIGLVLGPVVFVLVLLLPTPGSLTPEGQRAGAVALLMAIWWVSEALPLAATALVPLVLFPLLSVLPTGDTAARYADPVVFLFMGGFIIGLAMERSGLHKRLGFAILRSVGGSQRRMLLGFMLATAFISMWVSNTAAAVMMFPIATFVAVQSLGDREAPAGKTWFGSILMLGIAYSASVGGVVTLIGTPPNAIFAGQAALLFPSDKPVSFLSWMIFATPLAVGFLAVVYAYLTFLLRRARHDSAASVAPITNDLGRWTREQKWVLVVFVVAAMGWIGRGDVDIGGVTIPGWSTVFGLEGIHDATIAILAALLLFAVPLRWRPLTFAMDWDTAKRLPWNVLLLFGGGFALAEAFTTTGLAQWLASGLDDLGSLPTFVIVLMVCLLVTFLTEVTSNTATASMLMPIMAAAAIAMDVHPYTLMVPATVSASFAYMLPTATPPNAVVMGSDYVTVPLMARTGFVLNLLGAVWITAMVMLLAGPVLEAR